MITYFRNAVLSWLGGFGCHWHRDGVGLFDSLATGGIWYASLSEQSVGDYPGLDRTPNLAANKDEGIAKVE